jgi:hypothetical protein
MAATRPPFGRRPIDPRAAPHSAALRSLSRAVPFTLGRSDPAVFTSTSTRSEGRVLAAFHGVRIRGRCLRHAQDCTGKGGDDLSHGKPDAHFFAVSPLEHAPRLWPDGCQRSLLDGILLPGGLRAEPEPARFWSVSTRQASRCDDGEIRRCLHSLHAQEARG